MRRSIPLAAAASALVSGTLAVAACSADAKDFKTQGESYLESDEVRERLGMVRMSDAECAEPASTDEGTVYDCAARGGDGNMWRFTIEISGSESLRVTSAQVVGRLPGPTDSVVASEPTTTTIASSATTSPPTTASPASTGSG
jgi:hypothetical protein